MISDLSRSYILWLPTMLSFLIALVFLSPLLRSWRLDGIAYEFGDQIYDQPNRTMISHAEGMMLQGQHRGLKKEVRFVCLQSVVIPTIRGAIACLTLSNAAEIML